MRFMGGILTRNVTLQQGLGVALETRVWGVGGGEWANFELLTSLDLVERLRRVGVRGRAMLETQAGEHHERDRVRHERDHVREEEVHEEVLLMCGHYISD